MTEVFRMPMIYKLRVRSRCLEKTQWYVLTGNNITLGDMTEVFRMPMIYKLRMRSRCLEKTQLYVLTGNNITLGDFR